MSHEDEKQRKIEELERRCARLEGELGKVRTEQITYLQNVSHQLVAPLNAIKWHIENLTQARVGVDRAKKVLRSIYSQSTIAVHLAKNFALMSNLEADHALSALKEPLQAVSLCALAINLADDFQPLGWDRDIQIKVDTEGFQDTPTVLLMKPLISQAFSNIIENAVKYSENGSTILINGQYNKEKDSVVVSVMNRGVPLPTDVEEVFERGYRSEGARNKHPAGTGFGLYIAKKIIEIHGGDISAHTTSKGMAMFSVSLSVRGLEGKARIRDPKNRTPH